MAKAGFEKKIPTKNYVILLVIFLITFLLAYYIYKWYEVYSEYQNDIPVIRDSLNEVSEEEMDHYVRENQLSVVYICTAADIRCRNFEKSFKKLVEQDSLKEYMIYVNLTEDNKNDFVEHFNSSYPSKRKLHQYPALIVFEDGEISDIIEESKTEKLSISEIKRFLKRNQIGSKYQE